MKKASSPVDNRKLENGQSFSDFNESLKNQGNLKNTGTMEALETLQENKRASKVLFIQAMAQKEAEDYAHKCRYLKNQAQAKAVFALYRMGREYFFSKLPGDSLLRELLMHLLAYVLTAIITIFLSSTTPRDCYPMILSVREKVPITLHQSRSCSLREQ